MYTYFLISTLNFHAERKAPQAHQIWSSYFLSVISHFMFLVFVGGKLNTYSFTE